MFQALQQDELRAATVAKFYSSGAATTCLQTDFETVPVQRVVKRYPGYLPRERQVRCANKGG